MSRREGRYRDGDASRLEAILIMTVCAVVVAIVVISYGLTS